MTRYLSLALGATEPIFSQSIGQLEQASGRPSADIRLSSEMMRRAQAKIAELGLDPQDTTGPELYGALRERLHQNEAQVREALGIEANAPSSEIVRRVQQFLDHLEMPKSCFALKSSVARRLMRTKPPRLAMKRLGYRSLDSMLKHETAAQLYAAALMFEGPQWHKTFREQYAKLQPSDFEQRAINIVFPTAKRWEKAAAAYTATARQNIISFRELGTVLLLPITEQMDGLTITTILLALNAVNDIRVLSSFAKLQQVKSDFGKIMQQASVVEPLTSATLAGQPVPWRTIQRYYARFKKDAYHAEVFEPHVQSDDLVWEHAEDTLAKLAPSLAFWQDTQALCVLHDGEPVSFNVLDVALGYCNHLSFGERIVHFVRDNLWHELMLRYLNQDNLEQAVRQQLAGELTDGIALAE